MRHLTVNEALETYSRIMQQSGGTGGIHDLGALESAVAQPRMTFGGEELYPAIVEKASALGFSLIQNHPVTIQPLRHENTKGKKRQTLSDKINKNRLDSMFSRKDL